MEKLYPTSACWQQYFCVWIDVTHPRLRLSLFLRFIYRCHKLGWTRHDLKLELLVFGQLYKSWNCLWRKNAFCGVLQKNCRKIIYNSNLDKFLPDKQTRWCAENLILSNVNFSVFTILILMFCSTYYWPCQVTILHLLYFRHHNSESRENFDFYLTVYGPKFCNY